MPALQVFQPRADSPQGCSEALLAMTAGPGKRSRLWGGRKRARRVYRDIRTGTEQAGAGSRGRPAVEIVLCA